MKSDDKQVNPLVPAEDTATLNTTDESAASNNGENSTELRRDTAVVASGKRSVSNRKIESNRRNSQKSTGPKTATGKKRVSRNAVRHGFFSKFLLIQHPDGKESQGEYDDFYDGVRKHYQPVGWLEEAWVEKIAVWSWRLRRLIRCEAGQIDRALAGHSYELQLSKADDLADPDSASSRDPETDALTDHLFLPEKEELDKLLRYEAMINRQLNHAMGELERVQTRRKGEATRSISSSTAKQSQEVL